MWEPRINVEGFGERKADVHVRPRYAGMAHVETGDDISSPFDHDDKPDRGYNVNVQGSNLEPDEVVLLDVGVEGKHAADAERRHPQVAADNVATLVTESHHATVALDTKQFEGVFDDVEERRF